MKTRTQILSEIQLLQKQLEQLEQLDEPPKSIIHPPVIFRYFRKFRGRTDDLESRGGYTFAFRIFFGDRIDVGVSQCSDYDNFNKEIGRFLAEQKLTNNPYRIEWNQYNDEDTLIENYIMSLFGNVNLTRFQKTLLKYNKEFFL
jgi:hypothetical protein